MDRILIPIIALVAAWILGAVFTKMLIPFSVKRAESLARIPAREKSGIP